jgi:hypothetical protein
MEGEELASLAKREGALSSKVTQFEKLAHAIARRHQRRVAAPSPTAPGLHARPAAAADSGGGGGGGGADASAEEKQLEHANDLRVEIEEALASLETEVERLSAAQSARGGGDAASYRLHSLADRVSEVGKAFRRARSALQQAVERAELLGAARDGEGKRDNEELLLGERAALQRSIRIADDFLGMGLEARKSLSAQQSLLATAQNKLHAAASMFPGVNRLVRSISNYRNRDTIVLAFVMACCLLFTFIYLTSH